MPAHRVRPRSHPSGIRWWAVAVILGMTVATHQRARVWCSEVALWQSAVRSTPLKPRPRMNLGTAYAHADAFDQARVHFHYAIHLTHGSTRSPDERLNGPELGRINLAILDWREGDYLGAQLRLRDITIRRPDFTSIQPLCVSVGC